MTLSVMVTEYGGGRVNVGSSDAASERRRKRKRSLQIRFGFIVRGEFGAERRTGRE